MTFDFSKYLNSINYTKENVFDPNDEYVPFLINRSMTYFTDTLLLSNNIAKYSNFSDNSAHYMYWICSVSKRRRFSKWNKTQVSNIVPAIVSIYNVSKKKAIEYEKCLTDDQKVHIMKMYKSIKT